MDNQHEVSPNGNSWRYNSDNNATVPIVQPAVEPSSQSLEQPPQEAFAWTATDTFSNSKGLLWYLALLVITLIFATVMYLITKDKITTGTIIVCGLLAGFYAAKKPRTVSYSIDKHGFQISSHYSKFSNFKSYSLTVDGGNFSVALVPLRRFLPLTYLNFSNEISDKIMPILL